MLTASGALRGKAYNSLSKFGDFCPSTVLAEAGGIFHWAHNKLNTFAEELLADGSNMLQMIRRFVELLLVRAAYCGFIVFGHISSTHAFAGKPRLRWKTLRKPSPKGCGDLRVGLNAGYWCWWCWCGSLARCLFTAACFMNIW